MMTFIKTHFSYSYKKLLMEHLGKEMKTLEMSSIPSSAQPFYYYSYFEKNTGEY